MEAAENGSTNNNFTFSELNSFTALLELPPNQAVELLVHSPENIKQELLDSYSTPAPSHGVSSSKRKGREKRVKSNKLIVEEDGNGGGEKLPYVHVRACRGKATNSHSLAERARREKINARMKLLQEMVPGCNKISGTASVLDEIINHVQFLQRQVEFLSIKLAAADPRIGFNLDNFMTTEDGSPVGSNILGMVSPSVCNEQIRPQYQHLWQLDCFQQPALVKEDDSSNFIQTENTADPAENGTLRMEPKLCL